MAVRQHVEPPKKYVILTSHGVQIFIKLRPVDILRQILKESLGQDTWAIRTFFANIQKDEQACATALILASLETDENIDIAEYATRVFFLYGGEPRLAPPTSTNICKFRNILFLLLLRMR